MHLSIAKGISVCIRLKIRNNPQHGIRIIYMFGKQEHKRIVNLSRQDPDNNDEFLMTQTIMPQYIWRQSTEWLSDSVMAMAPNYLVSKCPTPSGQKSFEDVLILTGMECLRSFRSMSQCGRFTAQIQGCPKLDKRWRWRQ